MKYLFGKLFVVVALLVSAQLASAQSLGWSSTITASLGGSISSHSVYGSNQGDCENNRMVLTTSLTSMGYTILGNPPCSPNFLRRIVIPEWIERLPEWKIPFPGPVCLSCPYLDFENIRVIYPDDYKQVESLMRKYNVLEYNKEVLQLQEAYNLDEFEESMFNMEMENMVEGLKQ